MNPRISEVFPTNDYKLVLVFTNGERRLYDCSGRLDFGVFKELKDPGYFKQVKVLDGTAKKLKIHLLAYCLMNNHYHRFNFDFFYEIS